MGLLARSAATSVCIENEHKVRGPADTKDFAMGMTCTLYRVAAADIEGLFRDPARVREVLFADDENWIITRPKGLVGFLLRFTPMSVETATRKEPQTPEEIDRLKETECDLEGVWHGLHFLFTGTPWEGDEPACYLVRGGEEVGDDDFDTPPRLLRPGHVRDFSGFLGGLSEDELRRRYDPKRMTEMKIDPAGWWQRPTEPADAPLVQLLESFNELRAFIDRAAPAGNGLVVHLG
jgi:hypothetical protein